MVMCPDFFMIISPKCLAYFALYLNPDQKKNFKANDLKDFRNWDHVAPLFFQIIEDFIWMYHS